MNEGGNKERIAEGFRNRFLCDEIGYNRTNDNDIIFSARFLIDSNDLGAVILFTILTSAFSML